MNVWEAIILGLVEGITEYLPVSSTGHLILTAAFLGVDEGEAKGAVDAFNIVVQGGAILAVLGLYWPSVVRMIKGVFGRDEQGLRLFVNLMVAFFPAAVLGFLLDDLINEYLFSPAPVVAALILGGIYMILLEQWRTGRFSSPRPSMIEHGLDELTPAKALVIGLMQCVAMWPGTSRSMMTITGGVLVGLRPVAAAEFSFLLGLPTLGGATVYKLVKNVTQDDEPNLFEQLGVMPVLVGIIVAAVSAAIAVRWLVGFLNRHGLSVFGWYRIILGGVLAALIAAGVVVFD